MVQAPVRFRRRVQSHKRENIINLRIMVHDFKSAERLVNLEINDTISRWSQVENGKCYMIRHTEQSNDKQIVIQPTYDNVFFAISKYIQIAIACGCSLYVTCEKNQAGKLTPTLHIY